MATQQKIDIVEQYTQKFKDAKSIFLADFTGLNVEDTNNLRREFRNAGVEYRIIKNTLAKLSFKNAGIEEMDGFLTGCTAFAIGNDDPVSPVKVIKEYKKKNKNANLQIKGCLFEGKVFGAEQSDALAELPTREVLLGQLVGMLQSPMSKLLSVLQATGQKLVGTLESLKEQKS